MIFVAAVAVVVLVEAGKPLVPVGTEAVVVADIAVAVAVDSTLGVAVAAGIVVFRWTWRMAGESTKLDII